MRQSPGAGAARLSAVIFEYENSPKFPASAIPHPLAAVDIRDSMSAPKGYERTIKLALCSALRICKRRSQAA